MRLLFLIIITSPSFLYAQNQSRELEFAKYLMNKEQYDEASFVLKETLKENLDITIQDSTHLLLGQIYFRQKLLPQAIWQYDSVSIRTQSLNSESVFFSALSSSYLGNYEIAKQKLLNFSSASSDADLYNLRIHELAGIYLLDGDFHSYDSLTQYVDGSNYLISLQSDNFEFHKKKLLAVSKKSSLVAALLSAAIPGAGRMYVGKPGQGIYQLLVATILGLQTLEGYRKDGGRSARFIIYGTLFSSFYIANIWGSALGVKLYKNEVNKTVEDAILLDMHIPLRTIFR